MDKKLEAEMKKLESELVSFCNLIRGEFIFHCITMESQVDLFITKHFCGTKDNFIDFKNIILNSREATFSFKTTIFNYLVTNYYDWILKTNPTLLKDIETIISIRNILAHQQYIPNQEDVKNGISEVVIRYYKMERGKKKEKILVLNETITTGYFMKIAACCKCINTLIEKQK